MESRLRGGRTRGERLEGEEAAEAMRLTGKGGGESSAKTEVAKTVLADEAKGGEPCDEDDCEGEEAP